MTLNAKRTFLGRNEDSTGAVGGAPQRPNCGTGQSLEVPGKAVLLMIGGSGLVQAGERMLRSDVGTGFLQRLWEKPMWEGVWPCLALLGPVGQCVFTHSSRGVGRAREVRAAWRARFLPDSEGAVDDAG